MRTASAWRPITTHASAIGGDVFDSTDAPGYQTIERWLDGDGSCTEASR